MLKTLLSDHFRKIPAIIAETAQSGLFDFFIKNKIAEEKL